MVDSNSLGVLTNFGLGLVIFLSVLFLYDLLRHFFPQLHYPREAARQDPSMCSYTGEDFPALERLSSRPLSWVLSTITYSEKDTIASHGLDVALYVRFLATQIKVFFVLSIFTAVVLYPTYITAGNRFLSPDDPLRSVGIEIASLSNVPDKSSRLWVTLISEIFVVTTILFFLFTDIYHYTIYRRQYRSDPTNPSNYAIIIQDLPMDSRNPHFIRDLFNRIFPNAVVAVHPVRDAAALLSLKLKFLAAVRRRERAELVLEQSTRLSNSASSSSPNSSYFNIENEYMAEIAECHRRQEMLREVVRLKECNLDAIAPLTDATIVVFRSRRVATFAATAPIWTTRGSWNISRVAEPRAVNWNRLDINVYTRRIRRYMSALCMVGLAAFWTIPAGVIQALGNFKSFAEQYPDSFLQSIEENHPGFAKFLEGFLPPLLLFVVLLLIPLVVKLVVSFERIHSKVLYDAKVRNYLFFFYVVSNFVYVVLLGSVFKQLRALIQSPTSIVSLLSTTVPAQSTFLMKYVVINAFLGSTVRLLNVGRMLLRPILMARCYTERERRKADRIFTRYSFKKTYALCTMVSLISYVYSTIAPLICFVALLYFCIAYICNKQLLLYSHRPIFEGGGFLFRDAWTGLLVGLYVHQLSMIGIFLLKRAIPQAALAGASLAATIWFTLVVRERYFTRAKHGSVVDQLNENSGEEMEEDLANKFAALYVHPGLLSLEELGRLDYDENQDNKVESFL